MLTNILVLKFTFIGASSGIQNELDFEIDVVVVDSNERNDEKQIYSPTYSQLNQFHQVKPCEDDRVMANQRQPEEDMVSISTAEFLSLFLCFFRYPSITGISLGALHL